MKPIVAFLLALPALALAQGSLTPAAAPAPTMRTLTQIEPRTPLESGVPGVTVAANGGFVISAPGSYFLTANLAVSSGSGIEITASNVTLDLSGFTISSTASPNAGFAIAVANAQQGITIRNGHIVGSFTYDPSTGTGSGSGFARGIFSSSIIRNSLVSGLTIRGTSTDGIYLDQGSTIDHCVVEHCGGMALRAQVVTNSSAIDCNSGIAGETLSNCQAIAYNAAINATQTASNCTGTSTAGTGLNAANAENCIGTSTSGTGLNATQTATGSTGTTASGKYGLYVLGSATGCSGLSGYGYAGLFARIALDCDGNCPGGTYGLLADGAATNCTGFIGSASNTVAGSAAIRGGVVTGCNAENMSTTANTYGIFALISAHNSVGGGVIGIKANTSANFCHGVSTGTTSPVAISASTAIGCTGNGTIVATNKYLMP